MGIKNIEASNSDGLFPDYVRSLADYFSDLSVGGIATYRDILGLLNFEKIDSKCRSIIFAAKKLVLSERGIVMDSVRTIGFKRLSDGEIIGLGHGYSRKIRRASRLACNKISRVNYDELSNEKKIAHNTYMSVLGAVSVITQPSKIKTIERAVEKAHSKIEIGETLELMKK